MAAALGTKFFDGDGDELEPIPLAMAELASLDESGRIELPPVAQQGAAEPVGYRKVFRNMDLAHAGTAFTARYGGIAAGDERPDRAGLEHDVFAFISGSRPHGARLFFFAQSLRTCPQSWLQRCRD